MRKHIQPNDLKALLKLFAPKEYSLSIFDPLLVLKSTEGLPEEYMDLEFKVLVNFSPKIEQFKQYNLNEFDLIIDFGKCSTDHLYSERISYRNSSEGNIRWIFKPKNLRFVLSTYSSNNVRSIFIKKLISHLGKLRLGWLFRSGDFTIHTNIEMPFQQFVPTFDSAIAFLGTPGIGRKITLAKIENQCVLKFIKIPLSLITEKANTNEIEIINVLNKYKFECFDYPKYVGLSEDGSLVQTNNLRFYRQTNNLVSAYENVLYELFRKTTKKNMLLNLTMLTRIDGNLDLISWRSLGEFSDHIKLIQRLYADLDKSQQVLTTLAHGDFTPWNLKYLDNKAYLFDWEFGREQMPLMYDLFHFIIQSEIYTKGNQGIKLNQIYKSIEKTAFYERIQHDGIDISFYLKLYLMHQLAYHLSCIKFEPNLSRGLKAQINALFCLASEIEGANSYRIKFLENFQRFLIRSKEYTLLKFECNELVDLNEKSDLDILVSRSMEKDIVNFIKALSWRVEMKMVKKSFMTQLRVRFYDGSVLYIDLIRNFKRKAIAFLDAKEILMRSIKLKNGLKVPQPEHDLEYALLFYNLNGSNIPDKYIHLFSRNGIYENRITSYISAKYSLQLNDYRELFNLERESKAWISMIVGYRSRRNPLKLFYQKTQYLFDTFKTMWMDRGFMMTFSGVDGSGKSTIIQSFKNELRIIHRREVVLLRHRPRVLPILSSVKYGGIKNAETRAGNVLPRKGKAKPGIGSYMRFVYYYSDYLIGQVYVYFKYILRGKIVLYDRYYFDFIVDAKRSNISIPKSFSKKLYSLVYKPKYNILLWSEANDVFARKPEVELNQIVELNKGYKNLFRELSIEERHGNYRVIENKDIQLTLREILFTCREVA